MADFPENIVEPRTLANLQGISFDATKDKILFAEDYNKVANEVVAIENALGQNMQNVPHVLTVLDILNGTQSDMYTLYSVPDGFSCCITGLLINSRQTGSVDVPCSFYLYENQNDKYFNSFESNKVFPEVGDLFSEQNLYLSAGSSGLGDQVVSNDNAILLDFAGAKMIDDGTLSLKVFLIGFLIPSSV